MPVEVNLPDQTSPTKKDMEGKENTNSPAWNQVGGTVGKNPLRTSSAVLKQTTKGINSGPDTLTTAAVSKVEPAGKKNPRMSFTQNFLIKKSTQGKENSSMHLPENRVLGAYRGKIVESKISSFRKLSHSEDRNSLAPPAKSAAKTEPKKASVANTGNAPKPLHIAPLQTKPPVKVLVAQPKAIWSQEKPSVKTLSGNKVAIPKGRNTTWTPVLKTVPHHAANSEQRAKKAVQPTGALAGSASESSGTKRVLASKTGGSRKSAPLQSAEMRRSQLSEWRASKGKVLKKPPTPEPAPSFWAAIAEEDEQLLVSDMVNKTLKECLSLIEKGHSADKIQSTLEELIQGIPDAKKFAKYWVCRMRLEQLGTLEKVMAVYEEAILAGAQPKDELRRTLTDVLKDLKKLPHPDGECREKEVLLSCTVEGNLVEECVAVQPNSMAKSNEETSLKEAACRKSVLVDGDHRMCKKEQNDSEVQKNGIPAFKTPENDHAGSYTIKYNVSTTPSLESMKKKLQCENTESTVKDVKLLTPVRRSRRIEGKIRKLPNILKDHDPCVSSLEQLGELEEVTAFVYRPNSALHNVMEGHDKM